MGFSPLKINGVPQFHYCEPDWNWSPPPLGDFDIFFVVDGHGWLDVDGHCHEIRGGHCLVLRPGDQPRGTQDPKHNLVVFAAHFDPADALAHERLLQMPRCMRLRDPESCETLARMAASLAARTDEEAHSQLKLLLGHLLWTFWDENRAGAVPPPTAFVRLTEAIVQRPGQNWTVARMAAQCHLSRSQFTRRFKALYKSPPLAYVLDQRMRRARQLLTESNMSVGQIAAALGYAEAAFFSRQFKQVHGKSPLAYRIGLTRGDTHSAHGAGRNE